MSLARSLAIASENVKQAVAGANPHPTKHQDIPAGQQLGADSSAKQEPVQQQAPQVVEKVVEKTPTPTPTPAPATQASAPASQTTTHTQAQSKASRMSNIANKAADKLPHVQAKLPDTQVKLPSTPASAPSQGEQSQGKSMIAAADFDVGKPRPKGRVIPKIGQTVGKLIGMDAHKPSTPSPVQALTMGGAGKGGME